MTPNTLRGSDEASRKGTFAPLTPALGCAAGASPYRRVVRRIGGAGRATRRARPPPLAIPSRRTFVVHGVARGRAPVFARGAAERRRMELATHPELGPAQTPLLAIARLLEGSARGVLEVSQSCLGVSRWASGQGHRRTALAWGRRRPWWRRTTRGPRTGWGTFRAARRTTGAPRRGTAAPWAGAAQRGLEVVRDGVLRVGQPPDPEG
jgi:hypothetical protein